MTAARTELSLDVPHAPGAEPPPPPPPPPGVLLWVNGSRADPASATHLSALDRGFTLADGLFETMRAYHGSLFRLDQHLDRLDHGARVLGIPLPLDLRTLIGHAMRDARDAGVYDAAVRLTVSRGVSPPGLAPPPNAQPTVVLAVHALPVRNAALDQHALHVCTARARRNEHALTAGVKTLDYVESVLAFAEARAAGADDALFLDTAGHLSEATASNVFTVVGETLLTPPAGCGVLPGITRAAVLEIAAALGIPAREQAIVPDQLRDAGEAFLTSSLREIAPIASIDHRSMPNRAPGTVTRRVADAFAALVQRECAP